MEFDGELSAMGWPSWVQDIIDYEAFLDRNGGNRRMATILFLARPESFLDEYDDGWLADRPNCIRAILFELRDIFQIIIRLLEYVANSEANK